MKRVSCIIRWAQNAIKSVLIRRRQPLDTGVERGMKLEGNRIQREDATLLALKMQEETTHQGNTGGS